MIDLQMITDLGPLTIAGLILGCLAVSLGASYIYRSLDEKPFFLSTKSFFFLLGVLLLVVEAAGFWSWLEMMGLLWLSLLFLSQPFALGNSLRLSLSFSLMVAVLILSYSLDYILVSLLGPIHWSDNPLAIHPLYYLVRGGATGLFLYAWGYLWRKKDLYLEKLSQQASLTIPLLGILLLNVLVFRHFSILDRQAHALILIFSMSLLAVFLILWSSRRQLFTAKRLVQESKLAIDYLHKEIDQERRKKEEFQNLHHDFRHHLSLLRQLIIDGQVENAQNYTEVLMNQASPKSSSAPATGNPYVDAVLHMKYQEALAKDIKTSWQVEGRLGQEGYDDLAVALSNLLENAIRESSLSSRAFLTLSFIVEHNVLFLSISNSYQVRESERKGRGQAIARKIFEDYEGYFSIFPEEEVYRIEALAYLMVDR